MTLPTRQLIKDWQISGTSIAALAICIIQFVLIARLVPPTTEAYILRSSVYLGAIQIGQWWELFVPVVVVAGFVLFNFAISFLIYEKKRVFARFLCWFSLLLSLLLIGSTVIVSTSRLIS